MKTTFLTAIVFVIMILISAQSCRKDNEGMKDSKNAKNPTLSLRTTEDSLLQDKIFSFISRMNIVRDDPDHEGSETWNYSEDSTIWYIEAALNYVMTYDFRYYTDNGELHYTSIRDSVEAEIQANDEVYNIVEIQTAYDFLLDYLILFYNNIDSENKCFLILDVLGISDNYINTEFAFGTFEDDRSISPWYWGWALGDCDGNHVGIDAADILEYYINDFYGINYNQTSQFSFYTSISSSSWIVPGDVPTTPHQFGYYMLFEDYQEGTLVHHCMGPAEMSQFLNFLPTIASIYQPSGKITVHYDVRDQTAFGLTTNSLDYWFMIHETKITFAKHHIGTQTPPTL
jgi:hypothetical protein